MGIDGRQTLQIRGPEAVIQKIQDTCAMLTDGSEDILYISERFFGKNVKVTHRSERYIVFSYEFRNIPIHNYLQALLEKYPPCWMKNEFSTDSGHCGMWLGRFRSGVREIQELSWMELFIEEEHFGEDFSIY